MRHHTDPTAASRRRTATALASIATILVSVVAFAANPTAAAPPRCFGKPVTIFALAGVPTIGTAGDDVIMGTDGDDVIYGRGGNDRICGGGGNDAIYGGPGNDLLSGGPGNDVIYGGPGRNRIFGGPGDDVLHAGPGRNVLRGGPGDDIIIGQAGEDIMDGNAGGDVCRTERRTDRVRRCSIERAGVSEQVGALEARMVGQINRLRRSVGVAPLRTSRPMADLARRWSTVLPTSFAHNPAVGSQIPAGWRLWAENIGYRIDPSTGARNTMRSVHRALVASPGHYRNLVNPELTHVGVGIHLQGDGVYVTQVFARY